MSRQIDGYGLLFQIFPHGVPGLVVITWMSVSGTSSRINSACGYTLKCKYIYISQWKRCKKWEDENTTREWIKTTYVALRTAVSKYWNWYHDISQRLRSGLVSERRDSLRTECDTTRTRRKLDVDWQKLQRENILCRFICEEHHTHPVNVSHNIMMYNIWCRQKQTQYLYKKSCDSELSVALRITVWKAKGCGQRRKGMVTGHIVYPRQKQIAIFIAWLGFFPIRS